MVQLIVEQSYAEPITASDQAHAGLRLAPCLEPLGGRWLRSYLSSDGRRMFCIFEAPDAEAVRQAFRAAGLPFDRVWAAELITEQPAARLANASR